MKDTIYQIIMDDYYADLSQAQIDELVNATSIVIFGLLLIIVGIIGFIFAIVTIIKLGKATNKKQIIVHAIFI